MLKMDGTRAIVVPTSALSAVAISSPARTTPRFLDNQDEATVRAFATRRRREARLHKPRTDLPSYRQMKAQPGWQRAIFRVQPGRQVFNGISAVLTITAFSAGILAHWALSF